MAASTANVPGQPTDFATNLELAPIVILPRFRVPEFKEIVLVIAWKYGQHDLIRINRLNE